MRSDDELLNLMQNRPEPSLRFLGTKIINITNNQNRLPLENRRLVNDVVIDFINSRMPELNTGIKYENCLIDWQRFGYPDDLTEIKTFLNVISIPYTKNVVKIKPVNTRTNIFCNTYILEDFTVKNVPAPNGKSFYYITNSKAPIEEQIDHSVLKPGQGKNFTDFYYFDNKMVFVDLKYGLKPSIEEEVESQMAKLKSSYNTFHNANGLVIFMPNTGYYYLDLATGQYKLLSTNIPDGLFTV